MIIDEIENISLYEQIPDYAVEFIKNLTSDALCSKYKLNENDYVNIETYNTKPVTQGKFETHNDYIDIQLLLDGTEKIYLNNRQTLKILTPYNSEKDITFYSDDISTSDYVTLNGKNFIMLYPHEAHAPQIGDGKNVKKVVVKLKVK